MRIAVTGTTGRVGAALVRHLSTRHDVIPLPRQSCDLTDSRNLRAQLDRLECDVFLNPAGNTSLEECEADPTMALRTNAEAPAEIAHWAAQHQVPVYQFSTDYVFDGKAEGLHSERDSPCPVNIYGRSKLAGEQAVLAYPLNGVIRVSWVFGPEKTSFIDQVFDAALAGKPLAAVADKFSLPVYTGDLVGWVEHLIEQKATGVIHACNSGAPTTWHGMAVAVIEEMVACGRLTEIPDVRKQSLSEMTSFRATRPRFTAMDTSLLAAILGHSPRSWHEALTEHVRHRCSLL
jgi:dTDP-4-dehydrorhamnose reductase